MKKGFTLIEVTAVIAILGIIALIIIPIVDKNIKESKERSLEQTISNIKRAAENYSVEYDLGTDRESKSLSLSELQEKGYLKKNDIINPVTENKMNGCIIYRWDNAYNQYEFEYSEECDLGVIKVPEYTDNSGANQPDLLNNMIPVKYENGSWVFAKMSEKWYDYDAKEWANAVVLKDNPSKEYKAGDVISMDDIALMYVWIPRYTYTIFNGNNGSVEPQVIDITFERGTASNGTVSCTDVDFVNNPTSTVSEICTDTTQANNAIVNNVSTYTHPAFTFGNEELTGFWIGKFEVSTSKAEVTIKPNVDNLNRLTVSEFFGLIQNMSTVYSLNGDSHMIKNMEWGAVAYLKQSKYGLGLTDIGINNYFYDGIFMTGCGAIAGSERSETCNAYNTETGMLASTTGNVYGVYDMSGGAYEYTMGNMVDSTGIFNSSSAEFETIPDSKYYDAYAYDSSSGLTHARGKLGDATKETLAIFGNDWGGWTSDDAYFPRSSNSWFVRGDGYALREQAGVFSFQSGDGDNRPNTSTHVVLVR